MQMRKNMAQILFYVYALLILFSPFLVARIMVVNPNNPCVTDADCQRYRHKLATRMVCNIGFCLMDFTHDPYAPSLP
ncbi:putative Late nodulin [Medicago truncatula]|uniref:Nodule-specific cysteine-rich peptide 118 n=2 Tax=Medicago truncatula TaxID=3880 RepID=A7KH91_MEDTR|nr:nodule-specific cysteine-rich peptide 118 [Medicago truncatula]RHN59498.1 putative Late nodulin [Medicago truncatula]